MAKMNVRPDNLIALADMYWASFVMRLSFSRLSDSIESGLSAHRLMSRLHGHRMQIEMLPALVKSLILADRLSEATLCLEVLQVRCYR